MLNSLPLGSMPLPMFQLDRPDLSGMRAPAKRAREPTFGE